MRWRPRRDRGRRTSCGRSGRRRARVGARPPRRIRATPPSRAPCRGRRRRRCGRRARRAARWPPRGRCAPPTTALRRGSPAGRLTGATPGSRCGAGRTRAARPRRRQARRRLVTSSSMSSMRPRPAAARRFGGTTSCSASSSAVSRWPQNSADDERRAAVTASRDAGGRAGGEQHPGELGQAAVGRLVQRRPAVDVGARRVRAVVEQDGDEALVAGRRGHPEQVVVVRRARVRERGMAIELRPQAVDVMGLDRAVRAHERVLVRAQRRDVPPEVLPAAQPVLAREDEARAVIAQRRLPAIERGDHAVDAVAGGREQPAGAVLVVVEVRAKRGRDALGPISHASTRSRSSPARYDLDEASRVEYS